MLALFRRYYFSCVPGIVHELASFHVATDGGYHGGLGCLSEVFCKCNISSEVFWHRILIVQQLNFSELVSHPDVVTVILFILVFRYCVKLWAMIAVSHASDKHFPSNGSSHYHPPHLASNSSCLDHSHYHPPHRTSNSSYLDHSHYTQTTSNLKPNLISHSELEMIYITAQTMLGDQPCNKAIMHMQLAYSVAIRHAQNAEFEECARKMVEYDHQKAIIYERVAAIMQEAAQDASFFERSVFEIKRLTDRPSVFAIMVFCTSAMIATGGAVFFRVLTPAPKPLDTVGAASTIISDVLEAIGYGVACLGSVGARVVICL
ncbi:hypothetical protein BDD12DRAFT_127702 [Trichophaea hybrida]|nr:hypothetical protein BDD12DRAFT_127702 [Trichophaea hybrida]